MIHKVVATGKLQPGFAEGVTVDVGHTQALVGCWTRQ
jgi:hypothetical protein